MSARSPNAQLVSAIFEEVAKGNGAPFWEACHDDVVWRTRDGKRYDNDYAFVIHFKDGKIVRYEEYCDTDLIARVLQDRIAAKTMAKSP